MFLFLGLILSYLLGSIPTAYIFGRVLKGIDIRQYGSGNIGATNVFRVVGKIPGVIVLSLDILKGYIPVVFFSEIFLDLDTISVARPQIYKILLGLFAITGHNWPIFLKFKGGKGVATSAGVVIGLIPKILLVGLLIWLVTFFITGYVSLGSLVASVSIPIFCLFFGQGTEIIVFTSVLSLIIVYKHRPNIKRLVRGEEKKIILVGRKK